jgi:hypothetical protein
LRDQGVRLNNVADDGDHILDLAACCADVEIMDLLAEVGGRVAGLSLSETDLQSCWRKFEVERIADYVGKREPLEIERAAFKRLLESIPHPD